MSIGRLALSVEDGELSGLSMPTPAVPGAPKVLADQLVLPYVVGRDFARAVWQMYLGERNIDSDMKKELVARLPVD